jgi:hypothetical protein
MNFVLSSSTTRTNLAFENGYLVGPADTAETWATHFISRGWTTPQDQITAGYPRYLQPSLTGATYTEVFDYGTILAATIVTSTLSMTTVTGTVTAACQLSYKKRLTLTGTTGWTAGNASVTGSGTAFLTELVAGDTIIAPNGTVVTVLSITNNTSLTLTANYGGSTVSGQTTSFPWINTTAGLTSALFSTFRYVQVVWTLSCSAGANLAKITAHNLKLSYKLRADSGTFTITNANAGVVVPFNLAFVDCDTPLIQPNGTTALIPIVDFTDVPNPVNFTVYLHNPTTGVKVTGSGSWQTRGF